MKYGKLVLGTSLGVLLTIGTACSGNKTAENSPVASSGDGKGTAPAAAVAKDAGNALVRFVNATPSSKDLAFGDAAPFSNVGSKDITEYKSLPAERRDFKLLLNGDAAKVIASNNEGLSAGKHYTVLAVTEKDGTFTLDPVSDDLTPPSPGKAKVRVINLAPDLQSLDIYFGLEKAPFISGAGLDHPTDYKEVIPANGSLNVRGTSSKKSGETVKNVQLEAGKLYTILVFGDPKGKLKVKTIEDVFTEAPNGAK